MDSLIGKKVRVYRNLRRGCWSIQEKGRVVGYANSVLLTNASFKVNISGYERFQREGRKNVHAFVVGELVAIDCPRPQNLTIECTYNPKKSFNFYTVQKGFKGREYEFHHSELLTGAYCDAKTIFVRKRPE